MHGAGMIEDLEDRHLLPHALLLLRDVHLWWLPWVRNLDLLVLEPTGRRQGELMLVDALTLIARVVYGVLQVREEIQSSKDVAGGVWRC
jgi:hypothetical protein